MSRPGRVTPRFPSIIHRAAAASAPAFNSPDDHIIPPPKRDRQGGGRGEDGERKKTIPNEVEGEEEEEWRKEDIRFSFFFTIRSLVNPMCCLFL